MAEMTEPPEMDIGGAKAPRRDRAHRRRRRREVLGRAGQRRPCDPTPVHGKGDRVVRAAAHRVEKLTRADREHDAIYESRRLTRRGGSVRAAGLRQLDLAGFDSTRLFVTTSIVDTFVARAWPSERLCRCSSSTTPSGR